MQVKAALCVIGELTKMSSTWVAEIPMKLGAEVQAPEDRHAIG